jgi:hypothetical protein
LKKYIRIDDPLKELSKKIRKDYFKGRDPLIHSLISGISKLGLFTNLPNRKLIFTLIFLLAGFRVVAPDSNCIVIPESPCVHPFSGLMYATAMVETMGNPFAYNVLENAAGIFQIRQVRVDEYNRLTGSKYLLKDMFDHTVSEKVFLYFASLAGPYDLEKIAKRWNGSGPRTEIYWKRIKEYL